LPFSERIGPTFSRVARKRRRATRVNSHEGADMTGKFVRSSSALLLFTLVLQSPALASPSDYVPERPGIGASTTTGTTIGVAWGAPSWLAIAEGYKGTNPTRKNSLWCADFMNLVLAQSGAKTSKSSMARSFASYGTRLSGPQIGAIAVLSRGKRGGHVGIVKGIDARGNPIIISGNHGRRVGEGTYSRNRVIAYVWPS
jgi:uncharacterized protein (TIGR02594 family)